MTEEEAADFLVQAGEYDPYQTCATPPGWASTVFACPGCGKLNRSRQEVEQGIWCPDCKNPLLPRQ